MPQVDSIEFFQDDKLVHKAACTVQPDEGYIALSVPWSRPFADLLKKNPRVKVHDPDEGWQDFTMTVPPMAGKSILLQQDREPTFVAEPDP
jgi:hypothetical protein